MIFKAKKRVTIGKLNKAITDKLEGARKNDL